jgi:uncharacterized protein
VQTLFEGKFFVLFSFVFGWGAGIQMQVALKAGVPELRRLLRRLLGLALIGTAHATLVFFGDILVLYALLGLPLLLLRHASPRRLVQVAMGAMVLAFIVLFILAVNIGQLGQPGQTLNAQAGYLGGFAEATRQRLDDWPIGFVFILLFNGPIAFAAFCAGLAAAKVGFFESGNIIYERLRSRVPLLLAVSLPLNVLYALASSGFLGEGPMAALGFSALAIAGPALSTVYLVAAVELARRGRFQGATVAAGRVSLSAYVLEGLLAGLIFNGYGLGLYGSVGAVGCIAVAVAIYVATHGLAALWLSKFTNGPLETILRLITRGR